MTILGGVSKVRKKSKNRCQEKKMLVQNFKFQNLYTEMTALQKY